MTVAASEALVYAAWNHLRAKLGGSVGRGAKARASAAVMDELMQDVTRGPRLGRHDTNTFRERSDGLQPSGQPVDLGTLSLPPSATMARQTDRSKRGLSLGYWFERLIHPSSLPNPF